MGNVISKIITQATSYYKGCYVKTCKENAAKKVDGKTLNKFNCFAKQGKQILKTIIWLKRFQFPVEQNQQFFFSLTSQY